jgi:hypothetical protein
MIFLLKSTANKPNITWNPNLSQIDYLIVGAKKNGKFNLNRLCYKIFLVK